MLPLEFTVAGRPVSHHTRNRARLRGWQAKVRAAARVGWDGRTPSVDAVRVVVAYYRDRRRPVLDNDNLLKPVQDALNGVVYADDRQVTHVEVTQGQLNGRFYVRGVSLVLLAGFSAGREFVYVKIERAPDPARLPR